ncbi:MAG: exosortase H-associated membrane protein [Sulfurimicrobium sp.]|nr:exosortase H-associated membrane protein [Sulfurimicrobium sp.]
MFTTLYQSLCAYCRAWIMQSFFSSWVESVEWSKRILGVATTLKLGMAPGMPEGEYALVLEVNPLAYGYGLPLFAALLLASSEAKRWRKLVPGALLQVPFQAWGICFDLLKQAAVTSGPAVTAQTGLMPWQVEGVALGYQFGALILPAMAPIGLWLAFNRGFIPMLMLEGGCCAGSREILSARLQGIE